MLAFLFKALFLPLLLWATPSKVILISWDGFGTNVAQRNQLPALEALKSRGVYTFRAKTILPAVTLISHTSMLTGLTPDHHKVDWNDWKPERGLIKVPSIFDVAKDHKLTTAMVVAKDKFRHFLHPGAVDWFEVHKTADEVAERAIKVLARHHPDFLFLHFAEVDVVGHHIGWLTPEQDAAAKDCDKALAKLTDYLKKAGLWDKTTVILTADHGGHEKTHGLDIDSDRLIPWIAAGAKVGKPGEIQKAVNTFDTTATAAWLLEIPPPPNWDGKSVLPRE